MTASFRGLATQQKGKEKEEKELSKFEKVKLLFREHGVAFAALYAGAYTVTLVPILAAITMGGVDGPELILWGAEKLGITYDMSWIKDGTFSKEFINAIIALELNGWIEGVRLPLVMAATPKASKWLEERRRKV